MTPSNATPAGAPALTSRGFRITVDDGRESFYALSIEDPEMEDSWLMSDTAVDLDTMR